mgnify:CR=1 FL=1|tara:strand:- start:51 stop:191 length:141 start_codon:yes stop_codon:yes gene_type:complete
MSLIVSASVFIALYKLSTFQDKTDSQKHQDYKKELSELYKLKKLKK